VKSIQIIKPAAPAPSLEPPAASRQPQAVSLQASAAPRALVTGATGFVGSHLVERLLAAGVQVMCLVRPSSGRRWLEGLKVRFCEAAFDDAAALAAAAAGMDYVFHVAGLTRARSLAAYLAVNERCTQAMLAAATAGGRAVRRFVYVSSLAAVGPAPTEQPLDESAPANPLGFYGQSKLAGERACLAAAASAAGKLPVTIIRPPAVYGPRDTNFLPLFRTAARRGIFPFIGSPENQLSLLHVSDLAEGIWQAASSPAAAGQTYFLGSGTHSQGQFADALGAALGAAAGAKPLRRVRIPRLLAKLVGELGELKWTLTGKPQIISRRKIRDALQPRWTCTWARAQREIGYRPRVELVEGLRAAAQWYRQQGWL
jgi:nucleoside-diphosphate-sugar epimerase